MHGYCDEFCKRDVVPVNNAKTWISGGIAPRILQLDAGWGER